MPKITIREDGKKWRRYGKDHMLCEDDCKEMVNGICKKHSVFIMQDKINNYRFNIKCKQCIIDTMIPFLTLLSDAVR